MKHSYSAIFHHIVFSTRQRQAARGIRGSLWPGWQRGFAAFSVSRSCIANVERYIRQQKEHHRKKTFEEELIALLEANGVEFNS